MALTPESSGCDISFAEDQVIRRVLSCYSDKPVVTFKYAQPCIVTIIKSRSVKYDAALTFREKSSLSKSVSGLDKV